MKKLYPMLLAACLLLTGCAKRDIKAGYEAFSRRLSACEALSFTANVRAEYEDKTARFTLSYSEDSEGSTVTVLAPELIAGVSARVVEGGTQLEYDSVVLDTGSLDSFGLSPMSSLPLLVQSMRKAHLDSFWEEGGLTALEFEPDDGMRCRVFFEPEGMLPLRAELISEGRVTVYIDISDWNEG